MGVAKTDEFAISDKQVAQYARALAHPARVAIIRMLLKRQACICGDIVSDLPLSQSTVSQHLKELKKAGLIKGEVEGARVCYCIHAEEWEKARKHLAKLFEMPVKSNECC